MSPIIAKTFGGLSGSYYVRHFLFGLIFPVFLLFAFGQTATPHPVPLSICVMLVVNTLLYPYARFVCEGVIGFHGEHRVLLVRGGNGPASHWVLTGYDKD